MQVNQEERNQKILLEVSQMLSQCHVSVSDNVSQLLPVCSVILSEMEQIVSVCQKKQQCQFSDEESDDDDLWWDSYEDLTALHSPSSVSSLSDVSFYSSEPDSVGDLFVQSLSETINRLAPRQIYSKA